MVTCGVASGGVRLDPARDLQVVHQRTLCEGFWDPSRGARPPSRGPPASYFYPVNHPPLVRHPQQLLGAFSESLVAYFALHLPSHRISFSTKVPRALLRSPEQRGGGIWDQAGEARQRSENYLRTSSRALDVRRQGSPRPTPAPEQGGSSFLGATGVGRHPARGDAAVRLGVPPARRRDSRRSLLSSQQTRSSRQAAPGA
jgi:hypothetical protein